MINWYELSNVVVAVPVVQQFLVVPLVQNILRYVGQQIVFLAYVLNVMCVEIDR